MDDGSLPRPGRRRDAGRERRGRLPEEHFEQPWVQPTPPPPADATPEELKTYERRKAAEPATLAAREYDRSAGCARRPARLLTDGSPQGCGWDGCTSGFRNFSARMSSPVSPSTSTTWRTVLSCWPTRSGRCSATSRMSCGRRWHGSASLWSWRASRGILQIGDDGPGVPAHELQSVLRPFYRSDKPRQPSTGGRRGACHCKSRSQAARWADCDLEQAGRRPYGRHELPPCAAYSVSGSLDKSPTACSIWT